MPKDNENIFLETTTDEPELPLPSPFAADQMVRCDNCLRANPPTRVNCLYCGGALALDESKVALQRPTLRPMESWEQGFNNIFVPPFARQSEETSKEVGELLRLRPDDADRILSSTIPLPLARASSLDEARLIQRRLTDFGINSIIVPDAEQSLDGRDLLKVRSLDITDDGMFGYQSPELPTLQIAWSDIVLIVTGRLLTKRVELKEEKGKRSENKILSASEFATDETVVEFYVSNEITPFRMTANSFDFSCLGPEKSLLANENIQRLINLLRERATRARFDDTFNSVRRALEPVWPASQQNDSSGWRRERPGKYSLGTVTELTNETQFMRYSRLCHHLLTASVSDPTINV